MAGNTFGQVFRVTTWGESHGPAVGAVIDGCPPRLPLSAAQVQAEPARRRPGRPAHPPTARGRGTGPGARAGPGAVAQAVLDGAGITVLAYTVELGGVPARFVDETTIWD